MVSFLQRWAEHSKEKVSDISTYFQNIQQKPDLTEHTAANNLSDIHDESNVQEYRVENNHSATKKEERYQLQHDEKDDRKKGKWSELVTIALSTLNA